MSDRKLYCIVRYKPSSMKRQILAVSHSIAALRRNHDGHVFEVGKKPMVGSQIGLNEYQIVGKEIKPLAAPAGVASAAPEPPAFSAEDKESHRTRRRYRYHRKGLIA